MLTGIRVEISGENVVLAATDRFRLAVRELTWSTDAADIEAAVLVPAKTLAEAAKAGSDGADVHLSLGAGAAVGKEGLLGIRSNGKRSTTPPARRGVPEIPSAAADRAHRHRHHRCRRTDRGHQARRPRRRSRRAGADGIRRRRAAAVGGRRRCRPRRRGSAGRVLRRAVDHRVQPDVSDRRAGFLALRACDVRFHDTQPSRGVAAGRDDDDATSVRAGPSRRLKPTTSIC